MSELSRSALLEELKKRQESREVKFAFADYTFPAQQRFFRDGSHRWRCAVTSRRAGKSTGIAADMLDTCLSEKGVLCLYITLTRESARNIIWGILLDLIEEHKIDAHIDRTRLHLVFNNGSKIMLSGAKDTTEIEKLRGLKLRKCYIDECQSFKRHLKILIEDIIVPALRDLRGELYLTGTPGPIPAGPFYEYSHSDSDRWHNCTWTAFDNPHMHNPPELDLNETLAEERAMKGIGENNPSYQRETYGRWIEDFDSLVFKFSSLMNVGVHDDPTEELKYVFGIDIGYNDADAIAVLGYEAKTQSVYLVEEIVNSRQDITALVGQIKQLQEKYKPVKMVMDAGALGKKIQEEIRTRHQLPLEAAEKSRKLEFIELFNDDLRTGKFKAFPDSIFQDDCTLIQWDQDYALRNPGKRKVGDIFHSDIADSVLYAWRECKHYIAESYTPTYSRNSDKFMELLEKREAERVERYQNDPDAWMDDFYDELDDDLI